MIAIPFRFMFTETMEERSTVVVGEESTRVIGATTFAASGLARSRRTDLGGNMALRKNEFASEIRALGHGHV